MKYKYIVLFPVPEPYATEIKAMMDPIEQLTGVPAPHKKLPPHMTFHRPIEDVPEERILQLTQSMVLQTPQTRITVSNLIAFGKEYIVLPAHATRGVASLWVGITALLAQLPEYRHGPYDSENTLHITIADHMTPHFDYVWPTLQDTRVKIMEIPVQTVEVWKKGLEKNHQWQKVVEYTLPLSGFMPQ